MVWATAAKFGGAWLADQLFGGGGKNEGESIPGYSRPGEYNVGTNFDPRQQSPEFWANYFAKKQGKPLPHPDAGGGQGQGQKLPDYKPRPLQPSAFEGEQGGLFRREGYDPLMYQGGRLGDWAMQYGQGSLQGSRYAHEAQRQALAAAQALREGPFVADLAGRQAQAKLARQGLAMARSVPGGYDPAAMRESMRATAEAQAQAHGQQLTARAQEDLARRAAYQQAMQQNYGAALMAEKQRGELAALYRRMGGDLFASDREAQQRLGQQRLMMHLGQLTEGGKKERYDKEYPLKVMTTFAKGVEGMAKGGKSAGLF
jgi:hypothetical protein